jgi:phospholipid/cholesterol/gamma-HCH transport system substrate-binding protein
MSPMSTKGRGKHALIGLAGLLAFVLIVSFCLAQYNQAFRSFVPVTVQADRAGLLMDSGSKVKLHGVVVGSVGKVTTTGQGASIALQLDPGMIDKIPSGVSADLVPPTVFGAKYVALMPSGTGEGHLQPNAVIGNSNVTSEINTTFDAVLKTLQAMRPAELNAMLNSVATTLQGKGKQIGDLIRETNDYLHQFNPSLPALTGDLPKASDVSDLYNQVTPDLMRTLDNGGALSDTLVQQRTQLNAFLLSFTRLGNDTSSFLAQNGQALTTTLDFLQPTIQLLSRYSPELPCLFGGLVRNDQLLSGVLGGPAMGGTHRELNVTATVLTRSLPAYKYPQDLPVVGADTGPDCHDLPVVNTKVPYVNYNTGANPYQTHQDGLGVSDVPLSVLLFGQQLPVSLPGGRR